MFFLKVPWVLLSLMLYYIKLMLLKERKLQFTYTVIKSWTNLQTDEINVHPRSKSSSKTLSCLIFIVHIIKRRNKCTFLSTEPSNTNKINKNSIQIESESFYQRLVTDMPEIPENELQQIKTKSRNTCERYCHFK